MDSFKEERRHSSSGEAFKRSIKRKGYSVSIENDNNKKEDGEEVDDDGDDDDNDDDFHGVLVRFKFFFFLKGFWVSYSFDSFV